VRPGAAAVERHALRALQHRPPQWKVLTPAAVDGCRTGACCCARQEEEHQEQDGETRGRQRPYKLVPRADRHGKPAGLGYGLVERQAGCLCLLWRPGCYLLPDSITESSVYSDSDISESNTIMLRIYRLVSYSCWSIFISPLGLTRPRMVTIGPAGLSRQ
jgi:hypothetical protein